MICKEEEIFCCMILSISTHTASSAPGYGTQSLHRHNMHKTSSEGEKKCQKRAKNCLKIHKKVLQSAHISSLEAYC